MAWTASNIKAVFISPNACLELIFSIRERYSSLTSQKSFFQSTFHSFFCGGFLFLLVRFNAFHQQSMSAREGAKWKWKWKWKHFQWAFLCIIAQGMCWLVCTLNKQSPHWLYIWRNVYFWERPYTQAMKITHKWICKGTYIYIMIQDYTRTYQLYIHISIQSQ